MTQVKEVLNWIFSIKEWITIENLFYLVSVVGIVVTICTYRRNSQLERVKWLYSLAEKFYEQPQYKEMRRIIEYETKEIKTIEEGIKKVEDGKETEEGEKKLMDLLDDYLNFFEFIGVLRKKNQLSLEEIKMVFEHYIKRIAAYNFLVNYINNYGYENLNELLAKLKSKKL
jgi:hypothetical protein